MKYVFKILNSSFKTEKGLCTKMENTKKLVQVFKRENDYRYTVW